LQDFDTFAVNRGARCLGKGSAVSDKRRAQKDGRCDEFRGAAEVSHRGVFMLLKSPDKGADESDDIVAQLEILSEQATQARL
jgi:hypothetical protein